MPTAAPVAKRCRWQPTERLVRAFAEVREELLGTLLSQLGSHEDAQDVAQEAFLKCWRIREELHVPGGGVRRYQGDSFYGGAQWILLTASLGSVASAK